MTNFPTIQLPRNFNFIAKLPARFMLSVLAEGNTTSEGRWYKVKIQGHTLNILSKVLLTKGQYLQVEKQNNLTLRIITKDSKKHTLQSTESPSAFSTFDQVSEPDKESAIERTTQLEINEFGQLYALISLLVLENEAETQWEITRQNFFFEVGSGEMRFSGVFKPKKNSKWELYLSVPSLTNSQVIINDLEPGLTSLSIEGIHITSEKHLSSFKSGVDIIS